MQRSLVTLLIGAVLGIILGFYIGWFALPAELIDVSPADLEAEFQSDYLRLIASTYAADQNLEEAATRIGSLGQENWPDWLREETVNQIITNPNDAETRHMIELARALGLDSPAFDQVVPTEPTLEPAGGDE